MLSKNNDRKHLIENNMIAIAKYIVQFMECNLIKIKMDEITQDQKNI